MGMRNTAETYGLLAKWLHWLTALLVLTLIPLGIYANDLPYETSEELAHKAAGPPPAIAVLWPGRLVRPVRAAIPVVSLSLGSHKKDRCLVSCCQPGTA